MHLKSCCALLLLALVACQAAPPQPKIDQKSISEETSKIGTDNLKLEDHGADKDRAKKSATFCVEIHSNQQVPCKEKESLIQVQPVALKEVAQPALQPVHVIRPEYRPPQTIHLIQPEVPIPPPQTIRFIQPEAPTSPPQTFHVIKAEDTKPPPQTFHVFQKPTPEPIKVEPLPSPPAIQPQTQIVLPASQPAPQPHTTNIVLPAIQPQLAPQPVHQQTLQPLNLYVPPPQTAQAQQAPIFNILPVPASSGCNQHLTVQEAKKEPLKKIEEEVKPQPQYRPELPLPEQLDNEAVEILPMETVPCQQEALFVPSRPVMLFEPNPVQLNHCERPHHVVTGCTCPQNLAYKSKGSLPMGQSWPRHHPKIHEHHVMMYPSAAPTMSASMPMIAKAPYSVLSLNANPSPVFFASEAQPASHGDTIITVHKDEHPHLVYPSRYVYPAEYSSYSHEAPTVTVNAYSNGPLYRQAQPIETKQDTLSMKNKQTGLVASQMTDFPKEVSNQNQKVEFVQLKNNE